MNNITLSLLINNDVFTKTTYINISNTQNHTCIDHFQWLELFHQNYQPIHVYLCLILCPIGVIANTLNVIVLCQPRLRSPTNLLLTFLAVSDGLVMFIYIIFDYFYLMTPRLLNGMTKSYANLLLINIVLQNLFHAFSAWIIVAVAIFRLIYIKTGVRAAIYCNMFKAWIVIILVIISSILLTIPFMIAHQIRIKSNNHDHYTTDNTSDNTTTTHLIYTTYNQSTTSILYEVDYTTNIHLKIILFWNSAILVKALPIIIMTTVSAALITSIRESEKRYRILRRHRNDCKNFQITIDTTRIDSFIHNNNKNNNEGEDKSITVIRPKQKCNSHIETYSGGRSANQTTYMLLTIIMLYIFTYLPQSALLLLNNFQGGCFSATVYERLGDFLDFLTLINNGLNFILYCVMSRQFRYTFLQLFCPFLNL
ncbi:unnamed protein product [Schistosoma rodhaini]|uniref:G-protein coupled receptors family 1 profile domain-containing protein n=1 Tax=Schistosoma rodhaini TaxID=6188 RepID=A0AA85ERQ0_9TREM|nr:unnamed protein product [Schistosoma rodhaini]